MKKHETEGLNLPDSPRQGSELDEKDETYFAEIRNFIDKVSDHQGIVGADS